MRLPFIFLASAPSIYSFCSPAVVMERSTASNTPSIYSLGALRTRKYSFRPLCRAISWTRGMALASGATM